MTINTSIPVSGISYNKVGMELACKGNRLVVAAPAGSTVIATKDGVTKTAVENNDTWAFNGLEAGEWTVTATNEGQVVSQIVTISPKTISISFKPVVSITATSGVTYTNGISGIDANMVSGIAKAISDNAEITNTTDAVYVDLGDIHRKISIGDQVTIALNGTDYAFDIIGFNHDELTDETAYGESTVTSKAGITLHTHGMLSVLDQMNTTNSTSGGWKNSLMRTSTMATVNGYLPSAWQSIIKPVNKASGKGGGSSSGTETVSDSCFLLAEIEIFGSTSNSVSGEGSQYAYYKAGNSTIKNKPDGNPYAWWERSPSTKGSNYFCCVNGGDGSAYYRYPNSEFGVAFAFCV